MASSVEPPNVPTGDAPRRKRLKIDVACETCRQKKVRCDGARPVCGYCSRKLSLRETCRYSNGEGNPKAHPSPVERPVERPPRPLVARAPETYIQPAPTASLANRSVPPLAPSYVRGGTDSSPATGDLHGATDRPLSTPGSHTQVSLAGSRTSINTVSPSAIDSMTTAIDEGTNTREVFGSSSAGSFTSQIKRAIDIRQGRRNNANHQPDRDVLSSTNLSVPGTLPGSEVSYVLPPRRQADHLMSQYWYYVDPLYPFLDRKRWDQTYEAIFAGTRLDVDECLFVATLNIVLALSTQLVETMSQEAREAASNNYLQRAQELQPIHLAGPVSLELVQYLLLTSQFLQSTDQPHHTWMVVGSAIRTAQSLGLHLEETSSGRADVGERELIRRVWYGCVLMDRMVSVTHGRPTMISHHLARTITEPSAKALGLGAGSGSVDRVSFFVKSIRLYEIMYRIINELYGSMNSAAKTKQGSPDSDDPELESDDDLDIVVRLDRCLNRWEHKIPSHLKWEQLAANNDQIHKRQTVILRMRYMHARLLLLRPVLSRFCLAHSPTETAYPNNSLQARLLEQGAQLCVSTAQETIADVVQHQQHDGKIGLLPAWWYRVYYVYTAATVLIAARLRPEAFPIAGLARSWTQAMTIMKAHEGFRDSVQRCVAALHVLSSKVLQSVPEGLSGSGAASPKMNGGADGHAGQPSNRPPLPSEHLELPLPPETMEEVNGVEMFRDFAPPTADLGGLEPADFNFDVNDMSWLHDMNGAWELLNE